MRKEVDQRSSELSHTGEKREKSYRVQGDGVEHGEHMGSYQLGPTEGYIELMEGANKKEIEGGK